MRVEGGTGTTNHNEFTGLVNANLRQRPGVPSYGLDMLAKMGQPRLQMIGNCDSCSRRVPDNNGNGVNWELQMGPIEGAGVGGGIQIGGSALETGYLLGAVVEALGGKKVDRQA